MLRFLATHRRIILVPVRIIVPLGAVALGVLGFRILGGGPVVEREERTEVVGPLVQTGAVERHEGSVDLRTSGLVIPHREIRLSAEVAGRIVMKEPGCREGRTVTAGTVLFEIDPADCEIEVRRLEKSIEEIEEQLAEYGVEIENGRRMLALAEEDLALQRRELQRSINLARSTAISETTVDQARMSELESRNRHASIENAIRLSEARRERLERVRERTRVQIESADLALLRTRIVAPITGRVVTDPVEEGAYVGRGAHLLTIEDTSRGEIRTRLRMTEIAEVRAGEDLAPSEGGSDAAGGEPIASAGSLPRRPVSILLNVGDQTYRWRGTLEGIEGGGVDAATRTLPVRIVVEDPAAPERATPDGFVPDPRGPALMRGVFVDVRIHLAAPEAGLLAVPASAVRPGDRVYVASPDRTLRIAKVTVVRRLDGRVLIDPSTSALAPGERVVVSPMTRVRDSMDIRIEDEGPTRGADPTAAGERERDRR